MPRQPSQSDSDSFLKQESHFSLSLRCKITWLIRPLGIGKYGYASLLHMSFNHGHRSGVCGDFRPLCLFAPFCVFHCLLQFSPCTNIQVYCILKRYTRYTFIYGLCALFVSKSMIFWVWWTSIDWTMHIRNHKDFRNKKCPIFHWRSN